MKKKINKAQAVILKELAKRLPQSVTYARSSEEITGADAMLTGLKPPKGEIDFDPERTYWHDVPLAVPDNHYRRLRKAWQSGGTVAVTKYISRFKPETQENGSINR